MKLSNNGELNTGGATAGEKVAAKHSEKPTLLRTKGLFQQSTRISEEAGSSFAGKTLSSLKIKDLWRNSHIVKVQ